MLLGRAEFRAFFFVCCSAPPKTANAEFSAASAHHQRRVRRFDCGILGSGFIIICLFVLGAIVRAVAATFSSFRPQQQRLIVSLT